MTDSKSGIKLIPVPANLISVNCEAPFTLTLAVPDTPDTTKTLPAIKISSL